MKQKYISLILVSFLSFTSLSGCQQNTSSTSEESSISASSAVSEDDTFTLKTVPEQAIKSYFSLNDYVEVKDDQSYFVLSVSENLAYRGKTIYVLASGASTVTIALEDDESKTATLSFNALEAVQMKLNTIFKVLKDNYTYTSYKISNSSWTDKLDSDKVDIRTKDYSADYSSTGYTGFVKGIDDNYYHYSMTDFYGSGLTVESGSFGKYGSQNSITALSLDVSDFTLEYDSNNNPTLVGYGTPSALSMIRTIVGYKTGIPYQVGGAGALVDTLQITFDSQNNLILRTYCHYTNGLLASYLLGYGVVSNINTTKNDALETYLATKTPILPMKISSVTDFMNKALASDNYYCRFLFKWYDTHVNALKPSKLLK